MSPPPRQAWPKPEAIPDLPFERAGATCRIVNYFSRTARQIKEKDSAWPCGNRRDDSQLFGNTPMGSFGLRQAGAGGIRANADLFERDWFEAGFSGTALHVH